MDAAMGEEQADGWEEQAGERTADEEGLAEDEESDRDARQKEDAAKKVKEEPNEEEDRQAAAPAAAPAPSGVHGVTAADEPPPRLLLDSKLGLPPVFDTILRHCVQHSDGADPNRELDGGKDTFVCAWCDDVFEPESEWSDTMWGLFQHLCATQKGGHPSPAWRQELHDDPAWQAQPAKKKKRKKRKKHWEEEEEDEKRSEQEDSEAERY